MNSSKPRLTYSVKEAADLLGVSTRSLYRHVEAGTVSHLAPISIGNRVVFPRKTVDALLNPAVSA